MRQATLLMSLLCLGILSACGGGGSSSSSGSGGTVSNAGSLFPGETLPLGATVSLSKSGRYLLPPGATRITTRCTGRVTVAVEGSGHTNTCDSPSGSASQTNVVNGAGGVVYGFGPEASAIVTAA